MKAGITKPRMHKCEIVRHTNEYSAAEDSIFLEGRPSMVIQVINYEMIIKLSLIIGDWA